jgi:hypothetical protein
VWLQILHINTKKGIGIKQKVEHKKKVKVKKGEKKKS